MTNILDNLLNSMSNAFNETRNESVDLNLNDDKTLKWRGLFKNKNSTGKRSIGGGGGSGSGNATGKKSSNTDVPSSSSSVSSTGATVSSIDGVDDQFELEIPKIENEINDANASGIENDEEDKKPVLDNENLRDQTTNENKQPLKRILRRKTFVATTPDRHQHTTTSPTPSSVPILLIETRNKKFRSKEISQSNNNNNKDGGGSETKIDVTTTEVPQQQQPQQQTPPPPPQQHPVTVKRGRGRGKKNPTINIDQEISQKSANLDVGQNKILTSSQQSAVDVNNETPITPKRLRRSERTQNSFGFIDSSSPVSIGTDLPTVPFLDDHTTTAAVNINDNKNDSLTTTTVVVAGTSNTTGNKRSGGKKKYSTTNLEDETTESLKRKRKSTTDDDATGGGGDGGSSGGGGSGDVSNNIPEKSKETQQEDNKTEININKLTPIVELTTPSPLTPISEHDNDKNTLIEKVKIEKEDEKPKVSDLVTIEVANTVIAPTNPTDNTENPVANVTTEKSSDENYEPPAENTASTVDLIKIPKKRGRKPGSKKILSSVSLAATSGNTTISTTASTSGQETIKKSTRFSKESSNAAAGAAGAASGSSGPNLGISVSGSMNSEKQVEVPSQRLSRRIKPTAKILANEELRYGFELQNNARLSLSSEQLDTDIDRSPPKLTDRHSPLKDQQIIVTNTIKNETESSSPSITNNKNGQSTFVSHNSASSASSSASSSSTSSSSSSSLLSSQQINGTSSRNNTNITNNSISNITKTNFKTQLHPPASPVSLSSSSLSTTSSSTTTLLIPSISISRTPPATTTSSASINQQPTISSPPQRPICPDPIDLLNTIKLEKINLNRSPEDNKKLNLKQKKRLIKQKEKHFNKLGLQRTKSNSDSSHDSSEADDVEEFVPTQKIKVGRPSVTLRLRTGNSHDYPSQQQTQPLLGPPALPPPPPPPPPATLTSSHQPPMVVITSPLSSTIGSNINGGNNNSNINGTTTNQERIILNIPMVNRPSGSSGRKSKNKSIESGNNRHNYSMPEETSRNYENSLILSTKHKTDSATVSSSAAAAAASTIPTTTTTQIKNNSTHSSQMTINPKKSASSHSLSHQQSQSSTAASPSSSSTSVIKKERDTTICLCNKPSKYYTKKTIETSHCRAIDQIEDQLIGCTNEINGQLLNLHRPSVRVSYTILCDDHRKRLLSHQSCAGCGIFCTQGKFILCEKNHLFHQDCATKFILNAPFNPEMPGGGLFECPTLVLKCPHCGSESPQQESLIKMNFRTVPVFVPHPRTVCGVSGGGGGGSSGAGSAGGISDGNDSFDGGIGSTIIIARPKRAKMSVVVHPEENCGVVGGVGSSTIIDPEKRRRNHAFHLELEKLIPPSIEDVILRAESRIPFSGTLNYGSRDLFYAINSNDINQVAEIIASGFDITSPLVEFQNGSCLHLVANFGSISMAYLILSRAKTVDFVNLSDRELRTAMMCAVVDQKNELLKLLVQCGGDVTLKGPSGMTALHLAAKNGNFIGVQIMLDAYRKSASLYRFEVYLNAIDDGGWTAIAWAAEMGYAEMVTYLVNFGADTQICDAENNTVLHWATLSDKTETVIPLLQGNCDVNVQNINGDTPLHIACRNGNTRLCLLLLAHGSNLELKNKRNETAYDCISSDDSQCARAVHFNKKIRDIAQFGERKIIYQDISNGRESYPIKVIKNHRCADGNDSDDLDLFPDFKYITKSIFYQNSIQIDYRISQMRICSCSDNCTTQTCQCSEISVKNWYNSEGRLNGDFNYKDPAMIFECNDVCGCNKLLCKNRIVQLGVKVALQIVECTNKLKGWGVHTMTDIPKGTFVVEYTGEILTDTEADHRLDDSYFFDLGASPHCIDAKFYGNVSRFFNHSCEPNVVPIRVYFDHQDLRFPKIAFFASRDILAGDEITFDYGDKFWIIKYKNFLCQCDTNSCRFSEKTIAKTLNEYNQRCGVMFRRGISLNSVK